MIELWDARKRHLTRADNLYAKVARAEARSEPSHAEAIRAFADRALLDARAVTGELCSTGDGQPILLAPLPQA